MGREIKYENAKPETFGSRVTWTEPSTTVEGSTDHLRVHQGTLAMISMPQVLGKLHEALHESWSHPRAVVWPVEAALEHEGRPMPKENSKRPQTVSGALHGPFGGPLRKP